MNSLAPDEAAPLLPPLSLDLATKDPHTFKQSLLSQLHKDHPLAGSVWDALSTQQPDAIDAIEIDVSTWACEVHGNSISLGVAPIPDDIKQARMFEPDRFDYAGDVMYRLTHELTHQFVSNMQNPDLMSNLFTAAVALREAPPNRGITMRGLHEFYKDEDPKIKGIEDILELTTMFLWDPSYLKEYLSILTDEENAKFRETYNLTHVSPEVSKILFTNIESSVADELTQTK